MALILHCIIFATISIVNASFFPHCSGINISSLPDLNLSEIAGTYYSYYLTDSFPNRSLRLTDPVLSFVLPQNKGFNKFFLLGAGTNPEAGGGCLQALVQMYQIKENRPCFAVKIIIPVRCQDEEWLFLKISEDKFVFYHCSKFRADGSCAHKIVRGVSTQATLSPADKLAFKDVFAKFGETLPEISDPLNNACQKIKRETRKFVDTDRRLKNNGNYY